VEGPHDFHGILIVTFAIHKSLFSKDGPKMNRQNGVLENGPVIKKVPS
jgi:hypothetical protein